jgi:hypothetical protein
MNVSKPIKVSAGEFITDSNFNPVLFALDQVKSFAKKMAKQESKRIGYALKVAGVRECEEYFTYTLK